jgi:lipid II:glycine glycyltransferase (peptidoglycan interpeptide bridge formation enzyme)
MASVRIKKLPLLPLGIAYITGGPMIRKNDTGDGEILKNFLHKLKEEYCQKRGLVLRIGPAIGSAEWNDMQKTIFQEEGFSITKNTATYRTFMLNINRSAEDIRKTLDQKWRNCLNRSEKNNLTIQTGNDEALFEKFLAIYDELRERKQFDVNLDANFYYTVQKKINGNQRFCISIAELEGKPAAGHVSSIAGDTCVYLLGASNSLGLEMKASYLLQWQTILHAKESGCLWYDLGGIDPDENPGVYHFKEGLGGTDITAPGPYEYTSSKTKKYIVQSCETAFRFCNKLFKLTAS